MNRTKIMALYLPQFHQTIENDLWWGTGFTEWNVVKNAKHLIKEIEQPRTPLYGYYNLSDVETIRKQAALAREYCIDGFVMYHYYSNGQLLLDKPAELLLKNQDIDIEYCFSWANHDWMRTWFSYNREMLRKQEYAKNLQQIKDHFNYLLHFFRDTRYIKIDNKPVMFIYQHESIPNFKEYRECWNSCAKENGFNGIFFIQTLGGKYLTIDSTFDAYFDFEPTYTTFRDMKVVHKVNRVKRAIKKVLKTEKVCNTFDYDSVIQNMLQRQENEPNHFLGVFAEWDNTPRHSHNGTVFRGFSIQKFEKQFRNQYEKSQRFGKRMLVIDAWNEWGEGAYLEPDKTYGYEKLKVIKRIIEE